MEGEVHLPCSPRARVAYGHIAGGLKPRWGSCSSGLSHRPSPGQEARPGAARLPPRDSAPSPSTTRLLPPARCADLLLGSVQALLPHLPGMRGARAPRGQRQHSGGMGTLGRPRVILLTYVLFALELTCLFMRFSIMPVSNPPPPCPGRPGHPCAPRSLSSSIGTAAGAGGGGAGLPGLLVGEPGDCASWALHQHFLSSGERQPQGGAIGSHPHCHAALLVAVPLPLAGLAPSLPPYWGPLPY